MTDNTLRKMNQLPLINWYSYTQTIHPYLLFKYGHDLQFLLKYCHYYFDMYLKNTKIVKWYRCQPEIMTTNKQTKLTELGKLHFHLIVEVEDYVLFCKKLKSLAIKIGRIQKIRNIPNLERLMFVERYLYKHYNHNPFPLLPLGKLTDNDKVIIWNTTHRHTKEEPMRQITNDITTYFQ